MSANMSGLYLIVALFDGAIGAGFFIYGVRQREAKALLCGVVLSALPMAGAGDLLLLALSVFTLGGYLAARKYL